ncbi:MAG TPA: nuclear transport factor 2 family protein [Verrucomicrobiae bacterium]|nr:nuclear transport factor 2 family protein [Verrucomicrobiae bacterium]
MAIARKDIALLFLRAASSGNARAACQKFVTPDFRHHNACFPGDAESLMHGMEENAARFPNKVLDVKRTLEDGAFVAVHSHVRLKPGDRGVALVHIFRFQDERIVELWDVGQPVPENLPNKNGMF